MGPVGDFLEYSFQDLGLHLTTIYCLDLSPFQDAGSSRRTRIIISI